MLVTSARQLILFTRGYMYNNVINIDYSKDIIKLTLQTHVRILQLLQAPASCILFLEYLFVKWYLL